jgi:signal peptidase II
MTDEASIDDIAAPRAMVSRNGLVAYGVATLVLVLDQLSKYWVLDVLKLPNRPPIRVLPIFELNMVWNPGVSFGLLRADSPTGRWLLVVFALVVVIALALWARRAARTFTAVALGMILGGALGNNLIDRIRFGAVADFLDFHGLGFFPWVFNVADSAISIGVVLLLLDSFLRPKDEPAT